MVRKPRALIIVLCAAGILANLVLDNVAPSAVWDLNIAFFSLGLMVEVWRH
jgi:hypothetical protein